MSSLITWTDKQSYYVVQHACISYSSVVFSHEHQFMWQYKVNVVYELLAHYIIIKILSWNRSVKRPCLYWLGFESLATSLR